jgi:hypothetical protein
MAPGFIKKIRGKEEKETKEEIRIESKSVFLEKGKDINTGKEKIIEFKNNENNAINDKELLKKPRQTKIQTIVIERDHELDLSRSEIENDDLIKIPSNIKDKIERIILKILYEEKSVKSLKILTEKVLEKANKERITISEKLINQRIYDLNKAEEIMFTQTEGWKIRI